MTNLVKLSILGSINERKHRNEAARNSNWKMFHVTVHDVPFLQKIGSEEAQTVETFERRIHGTPDSEVIHWPTSFSHPPPLPLKNLFALF